MQYSVLGSDGNQYGPVDLATLKQWSQEGRVFPTSQITDHISNRSMLASQMPELSMATAGTYSAPPAANYSQYPRMDVKPSLKSEETALWQILFRVGLGVALSLFTTAGGLIFTGMGLYYGIKAFADKDRNAVACLILSILGFGFVLFYTIYKFSNRTPSY